jgi:hypothetical protein
MPDYRDEATTRLADGLILTTSSMQTAHEICGCWQLARPEPKYNPAIQTHEGAADGRGD